MFNNLIESSSHRNEMKRRGRFFLFTTATYALLLAIAGVASIYAYDARMSEQSLEIVTMIPIELPAPESPTQPDRSAPASSGEENHSNDQDVYQRQVAMADTDRPDVVPDLISVEANPHLPMPDRGIVMFGPTDINPGGDRSTGSGKSERGGRPSRAVVVIDEPPPTPPEPQPKPVQKILRRAVINSEAILLPVPRYPQIAKDGRIQGVVSIQVLIDETGKVVSAQIVRGNPMLAGAARQAAYLARFSPTRIGDDAVKVSGTITYNFVLQ